MLLDRTHIDSLAERMIMRTGMNLVCVCIYSVYHPPLAESGAFCRARTQPLRPDPMGRDGVTPCPHSPNTRPNPFN